MSKEYIARDPRTGKPLNVARSKSKKQYIETEQGPWMAIPDMDVIPLAMGIIDECKIPWRSKDYHLTRKDGIMALTRIKGARANEAHKALLLGLEDDIKKVKFILFEHHYDNMIIKKYNFSDIHRLLINSGFEQIFKIKMPFRKSFDYIYENKNF